MNFKIRRRNRGNSNLFSFDNAIAISPFLSSYRITSIAHGSPDHRSQFGIYFTRSFRLERFPSIPSLPSQRRGIPNDQEAINEQVDDGAETEEHEHACDTVNSPRGSSPSGSRRSGRLKICIAFPLPSWQRTCSQPTLGDWERRERRKRETGEAKETGKQAGRQAGRQRRGGVKRTLHGVRLV